MSLYFDARDVDVFPGPLAGAREPSDPPGMGDSDVVFFERKLKQPGILVKRRSVNPIEMRRSHLKSDVSRT